MKGLLLAVGSRNPSFTFLLWISQEIGHFLLGFTRGILFTMIERESVDGGAVVACCTCGAAFGPKEPTLSNDSAEMAACPSPDVAGTAFILSVKAVAVVVAALSNTAELVVAVRLPKLWVLNDLR